MIGKKKSESALIREKSSSFFPRGDKHKTSRREVCFLTFLDGLAVDHRAPRRWSWKKKEEGISLYGICLLFYSSIG